MHQDTSKQNDKDNKPMNTQTNVGANRRNRSRKTLVSVRSLPDRIERFCRLLATIQRSTGELS